MAVSRPPAGAGPSGRKLWRELCAEYEFEVHEVAVLTAMVRTVDRLDALQDLIDTEGLVTTGHGTTKIHPAVVEYRQQAVALARLEASLRLPAGEDDGGATERRPQRRGAARGVYAINGGAA